MLDILLSYKHWISVKVYEVIDNSLENCKIINCIMSSIILHCLIIIIKLSKHQQNHTSNEM